MKKFAVVLFILMFALPFGVFAIEEPFGEDPLDVGGIKPFIIHERRFEIGIANINVHFANNFLSIKDVFQDTVYINLDELSKGFKINIGFDMTPIYFNFKAKKGYTIGFSTDIEGIGILNLSGNMLALNEASKELSEMSGAVFASVGVNTSFNVQKFKVKFNPSLFYSLLYVKPPALTYTMSNSNGTILNLGYDLQVYAAVPLENFGENLSLTAKPGFDFCAGVEYPLAKEIGLTKILPFLDFDVSLDFINVPIAASKMYDRMQISGSIGSGSAIDFTRLEDFFDNANGDPVYSNDTEAKVRRPFKMLLSLDWRPLFGSKLITITPVFGFCVNELYAEGNRGSIEAGLNGRLNLANFFIATLGFNYTNRMHVYSLGLALNVRAFEFNIGADLRSQDITKSWTGAGFGLNVGFKFGW